MKQILKSIFGRYLNQPFHQTLIDFRIIYVAAIYVTGWWCNKLINKALELERDTVGLELAGLYLVNFMALVPMFWKAIQELRKPYGDD